MRRTFYCDGSCKGNGYANSSGGFGVVEINSDDELVYQYQEFKSPTTNNEMELMAILHILQRLDKEKNLDYHIFRELPVVFSDSAYCVNIINDWMYKWERNNWKRPKDQEIKNLDIIKQIYNLKDLAEIKKVSGHSGIKWNEYTDKLATGEIRINIGSTISK